MKTKHRRAARAKHTLRDDLTMPKVVRRSQTLTEEEQKQCSKPVHASWHALCNGKGAPSDVRRLTEIISVCVLASEEINPLLVEITHCASAAIIAIADRFARINKFGVDSKSLEYIPLVIDFYDELLRLAKRAQLAQWLLRVQEIRSGK